MSCTRLAALALAAGALATTGCGGSAKPSDHVAKGANLSSKTSSVASGAPATTTVETTSAPGEPPRDKDNDRDNRTGSYYDKDDEAVLRYGRAASPAEERAIVSLVRQYYQAAATANGAAACPLLYSILAEVIPEEYGETSGPLRGTTCAAVMSKLFKQHQQQLAGELARLKVTGVRIEGTLGWAVLNFGANRPPGHIRTRIDSGAWRIRELLPAEMP
jgi:hypothetical protein